MKPTLVAIGALCASMLQACASKNESGTSQSASTPSAETPPTAPSGAPSSASMQGQIGGQLVTVGEHQVELKLFVDGYAEALVFDAQGKALAKPEGAKLTAHAVAEGDAKKDIGLAWEPALARFAASGRAETKLEPKPVEIELSFDGGKSASGTLSSTVLLVGPELGGTLVVAGDHGIEIVANADGTVEAAVHDRAGARISGDADAKLEVELTSVDGKLHAVALGWNAARACFTGKADAGVKLGVGPAKIGLAGKASVTLPKLVLRATAAHKGRVIVAGDFSVELAADGKTLVGYAFDASGAAYAKGDLDLAVRVGSGAFVKLTWDAPSLSYRAKIQGDLDLEAQPIFVSLKAEGKVHVGASFKANAKLDAKANAKLEAPDVNAKATLASNAKAKGTAKASVKPPQVKVTPPKVTVNKSASATSTSTGTGAKAKASAGFSIGIK